MTYHVKSGRQSRDINEARRKRDHSIADAIKESQRRKFPLKGDTNKQKREAACVEKKFEIGGYARMPSDQTVRMILEITDAFYLKLEGIEEFVLPCTAILAEAPSR